MPPPGVADDPAALSNAAPRQTAEQLVELIEAFLAAHPEAVVLDDGKPIFELANAQHSIKCEQGRCVLHFWSESRNLVRSVAGATTRKGVLRLNTERFGHRQTKLLEISSTAAPRTPGKREPARQAYLQLLQRVLSREFAGWSPDGFRAAMDLERSFGPAYTRGSLVRGNEAWAVIGLGATESQATIDGILTLGVLWLHHCRERSDGRCLYKGLRLVVPQGTAMLTLARLPWMNTAAAGWELFEFDERAEELTHRDPADQGNLRTRLVHHPDRTAAQERFAVATRAILGLVPPGEEHRVEQRLRSTAELAFLLHGLEFARARISLAPGSFAHTLEITVGVGPSETGLNPDTEPQIRERVAELFSRRTAAAVQRGRFLRPPAPGRSIGAFTGKPAHNRVASRLGSADAPSRLELRERALAAQQDPLFRAAPERWLESVLRENLAPLTRSLAPMPVADAGSSPRTFANDLDPDTVGNRVAAAPAWESRLRDLRANRERIIPRFDPRFVYSQVPAIAGAGDRGMLDLLGVTDDGRLAVLELKAADDLQLALQGLDYWIRVRHHHAATVDPATGYAGPNDLQRHGYFHDVELSPLPPRLYLIAPALRVHPATETVLRYLSPEVEWTLLALDERWREEVRVVWRKTGGGRYR